MVSKCDDGKQLGNTMFMSQIHHRMFFFFFKGIFFKKKLSKCTSIFMLQIFIKKPNNIAQGFVKNIYTKQIQSSSSSFDFFSFPPLFFFLLFFFFFLLLYCFFVFRSSSHKHKNQIKKKKDIPFYWMTTSRDNNLHNPKKPKLVATHEQIIKKQQASKAKN